MTNPDLMNTMTNAKALLQSGDFDRAAEAARSALTDEHDDADALYVLAVAQRYQGLHREALETLDRLDQVKPQFGRAFQERGHVHRAKGEIDLALSAYADAVRFNLGLPASWQALTELYTTKGEAASAEFARVQLTRLAALPRELVSVTSSIAEGQIYKAEQIVRAFLRESPDHVEAMRLLAQIGLKLNVLDDAEFLLESCVEFEPDNLLARIDYFQALTRRQKHESALEQATIIRDADSGNPAILLLYANALMAVGQYEDALDIFSAIRDRAPDASQLYMAQGHALKTIGQQAEAVESYQNAYRARADFGDAYWSLANLKTYRFTDLEIDQMKRQEAQADTSVEDRIHLCFALGKAHEDRGDFGTSFSFYELGNQLKREDLRYSADRMGAELDLQKTVCIRELFECQKGEGHPASDPIFIVGLPRAGSTLVEQILASHSQVDGTFELPKILSIVHRLGGRTNRNEESRYPTILKTLSADKLEALGKSYLEDTRVYRQGAPRFTDKMPNNFRHIGLIHLILPNAKIIDARRAPLDCCFSGFKQLFAEGQEFTYGLREVGQYYSDYIDLMAHWDEVLPGKVLRVHYEDVVTDLEREVRRILDHCDLPFEDACLTFHETERSVRTASSEQVRQPLYQSGIDQWRPYEQWLQPLKEALGNAQTEYEQ